MIGLFTDKQFKMILPHLFLIKTRFLSWIEIYVISLKSSLKTIKLLLKSIVVIRFLYENIKIAQDEIRY